MTKKGIIFIIGISFLGLSCSNSKVATQVHKTDYKPVFTDSRIADSTSLDSLVELEDSTSSELARAEDLYIKGVEANYNQEWKKAIGYFEEALEILANFDFEEDDENYKKSDRLLHEISAEYKTTLLFVGELSDESSISAFQEKFEDLKSFKKLKDKAAPLEAKAPENITYDIPVVWNKRVEAALIYLMTDSRRVYETYLKRAGKYVSLMKEIVKEKGLPEDIVYLPLIESGFNPKAYSWAHAVGPWQFISSTGRKYGLRRTWWYDERRDFIKSTYAACDYLKFLYNKFGDWHLALAAYNGGEGRIERSIKRQRTSDFWRLDLRRQTENYVPLFLAALIIVKQPEKYGFYIEPEPVMEFEEVAIDFCLDLKTVAEVLEFPLQSIKELNPELLRGVTPPNCPGYKLRIPPGSKETFLARFENTTIKKNLTWVRHRVKRGETVSTIARKYGVSTYAVIDANSLPKKHRIKAGQYLTIPVLASKYKPNYSNLVARKTVVNKILDKNYSIYLVKREDTIWDLARKFGTTTETIRKLNGFSARRKLYRGEKIKIPYRQENFIEKSAQQFVVYIVKSGDTIWEIAKGFSATADEILHWNQISDPSRIQAGDKLKIYLPE